MKGEEIKVPIQDNLKILNQKKIYSLGNKKIAVIAAFLLFVAMSLMILFSFQSINGISELKEEIENLKKSLKEIQKKIEDYDNKENLEIKLPNEEKDDYEFYTDYDYPIDDYDYTNYDNQEKTLLTGDLFTKDAKQATSAPRRKRSIIGYNQDDNYQSRNKNYYSTPPSSSNYYSGNKIRSTPNPTQLFSRKLRVYQDEDTHNSDDLSDIELTVPTGHTRHRQRRLELDDRHIIKTGRMRPLPVAHFSGDTSKYVLGQHDNFNGNGHLRHPQRTYIDWVTKDWVHTLGMDHHFELNNGYLTVKESGLYFIYAQIFYLDVHDMNGFRVHRNESEIILQCTTMTHSTEEVMKGNTCFTAGVEYLNENDKISLGDLSENRYSLFEPGKSFFGLIKLGDVKIK